MKRMIALFLCVTLTMFMLVGCGEKNTNANIENKKELVTKDNDLISTDDNSLYSSVIAERKERASNTGVYQKVILSFFTWTGAPAGLDRINSLISEHTKETLGLGVELMILDSAAYAGH